jgi:hypothetical protein
MGSFLQVLHEELMECSFVNNLHPGDTVGALTFVLGVEEDVGGDLEAITMRTVGVKNVDVSKELPGVAFPIELFRDRDLRRRRDVEVSQSTTHSISVDD